MTNLGKSPPPSTTQPGFLTVKPFEHPTARRARRLAERQRLHADYESGTSAAEIVASERADIRRLRQGPTMSGPQDPNSPAWRAYVDASAKWRADILAGRDAGPMPEPPARAPVDEGAFKRFVMKQEAARRRRLRPVLHEMRREAGCTAPRVRRTEERPRERRDSHGRSRRTSTSREDGSDGSPAASTHLPLGRGGSMR